MNTKLAAVAAVACLFAYEAGAETHFPSTPWRGVEHECAVAVERLPDTAPTGSRQTLRKVAICVVQNWPPTAGVTPEQLQYCIDAVWRDVWPLSVAEIEYTDRTMMCLRRAL